MLLVSLPYSIRMIFNIVKVLFDDEKMLPQLLTFGANTLDYSERTYFLFGLDISA